jgi:hypothetical protein
VDVKLESSASGKAQFSKPALITLSTQARMLLAPNTYSYLWAS